MRHPGSPFLIVGLLSLGLGATTVMFSLFDATFLRPLPVGHPEQLVRIVRPGPRVGMYSSFPYAYYQSLHDHAKTLAAVFGETGDLHFRLTEPLPAEQVTVQGVTPEYFEALGVHALYGRVLLPGDANGSPGMPPAVLSYGLWRRRFGGDPGVVNGRTLVLAGQRFAIVGVMPRDFNGLTIDVTPNLRIPLRAYLPLTHQTFDLAWFGLAGRLKPGFNPVRAQAECQVLFQSSMKDFLQGVMKLAPQALARELRVGVELEPLERGLSVIRDRYGSALKLMMASMILVVVIVCTNVGGLMLARAAAHEQETAVRLAMGATRLQMLRHVLAESFALAVFGAAGGLLVAVVAMPLAAHSLPPIRGIDTSMVLPSVDAQLDCRVFVFLAILSLLTMALFAFSPAIAVSRTNLDRLLRHARSSRKWRGRQVLVTCQVALCTLLLVMVSLLVRTLQKLQSTDPGFDRDHIATFTLNLSEQTDRAVFLRTLTDRIRSLPGVVSVAMSSIGVMREHGLASTVAPAGERARKTDFLNASRNNVSLEYFDTMGEHILGGRDFVASDLRGPNSRGPVMTIVNQAFARRFFPDVGPLGKRFGTGLDVANGAYEIIGVVADSKYRSIREPITPTFYTMSTDFDQLVLYVSTRMKPHAIIEPTRKVLTLLDPTLPFLEVHTLAEEVDNSMASERVTAALASTLGAVATLLAGVGIYGLMAYVVTERRREIGIRMALGAQPAQIAELVVGQTLTVTLFGVAAGLLGAIIVAPGIRSLLYGVSPQDPTSLLGAAVFVTITCVVAALYPAVRATRVDPMVALRYE